MTRSEKTKKWTDERTWKPLKSVRILWEYLSIRVMPCMVIQDASTASHVSRPRVRRYSSYVQCATRLSKTCHVETVSPKLPGTLDAPAMYKFVESTCGQIRIIDHQQSEY